MINSKLIQLISTFSKSELRAFQDFVASPYYNKNQDLVRFYSYLKKCAPEFSEKKIRREKVYQSIFPKKAYNEKEMNYLMSFLLKLSEKFIGLRYYEQQSVQSAYHQLNAFMDRNLEKHYNNQLRKVKTALDILPYRDNEYYLHQYLIAYTENQYFQQLRQRKFDPHLQDAANALELFFMATKLQLTCEMMDREKILAARYQHGTIDEVLAYIEKHPLEKHPAISIYHEILKTHQSEYTSDHFRQLKQLIFKYSHRFQLAELVFIYLHAINFCIQKIRKGNAEYGEEALELYMNGIKEKALFKSGYLTPWTYKNVVKLSLSLRKYDLCESFIREYTPSLAPESRENAWHYNLAELSYYRNDFGKAMDHLNQVEFTDIHYNLGARKMLLKIYHESEEEEALFSQLAAFKIFLKRNKLIPANVKAPYQNFIDLLSQLIRARASSIPSIRAKILNTRELTDRPWLLEKVTGNR